MAATLDRAAQAVARPRVRRRRWAQAIDLLDWFLKENTDPPRERQLRFQAAVFRWAQAQSWVDTGLAEPARSQAPRGGRHRARRRDRAVSSSRPAAATTRPWPITCGSGWRRPLPIAPISSLPAPPTGASRESEAHRSARTSPRRDRPGRLLAPAQGRPLAPAQANRPRPRRELDEAVKSKPAAAAGRGRRGQDPAIDRPETNMPTRSNRCNASPLDKPVKALWMVRIRLAKLAGLAGGRRAVRVESDLFRGSRSCEQDLARTTASTARAGQNRGRARPESAAGSLGVAGRRLRRAGRPAEGRRSHDAGRASRGCDRAWHRRPRYRFRGGGFLFQAGKFGDADAVLSQVADRPGRGPAAGQGRHAALSGARPGPGRRAARRLDRSLRDGPRAADSRLPRRPIHRRGPLAARRAGRRRRRSRTRAETLWSAIAPRLTALARLATGHRGPRSRRARPPANQSRSPQVARSFSSGPTAFSSVRSTRPNPRRPGPSSCSHGPGSTSRPCVGTPETARDLCERVSRLAGVPALHYRARLLRLVALVEIGRYVEAEREAQNHATWRIPTELTALLRRGPAARPVRCTAETDLRQRRFGLVLRLIVEPIVTQHRREVDAGSARAS